VSYAFVILAVTSSYAMVQIDTRVVRVIGWLKKMGLKDLDTRKTATPPAGGKRRECLSGLFLDGQFAAGGDHPQRADPAQGTGRH